MSGKTPVEIVQLPPEVIENILIFADLSTLDLLRFSSTCHQFRDIVTRSKVIWKHNLKIVWPQLYPVFLKHSNQDWYGDSQYLSGLVKKVHDLIGGMSPKFFGRFQEVMNYELMDYVNLALERNISYKCLIYILNDINENSKAKVVMTTKPYKGSYNLTKMHYATLVLRCLRHMFLKIKFLEIVKKPSIAVPELVLNLFGQWVDTNNEYPYDSVCDKIKDLTKQVEDALPKSHPLFQIPQEQRKKWETQFIEDNLYSPSVCRHLLSVIADILFNGLRITITDVTMLESITIHNVLRAYCGHTIIVSVIYAAVARRLGVRLDLISFQNHLFLLWRETFTMNCQEYYVDFQSGSLTKKGRCPYAGVKRVPAAENYSAISLLLYLNVEINNSRDILKERLAYIHNSVYLISYLRLTDPVFGKYLRNDSHTPQDTNDECIEPMNSDCISEQQSNLILKVFEIHNRPEKIPKNKRLVPKPHPPNVKYAVGMVCYHIRYDYVCVIRGWDTVCSASTQWQEHMGVASLKNGADQPFYNAIALDQSERYVAQENLIQLSPPIQFASIDEYIASEFSHFNGNYYVPNEEKESVYPEDGPIREAYFNAGAEPLQ